MGARIRDQDDGVSLVELLVAISVTTIVLAMIGGLFVAVTKITREGLNTRSSVGTAANAMSEIRRVIREAAPNPVSGGTTTPAVAAGGTDSSLTVISYIDTSTTTYAPTKVAFSVNTAGYLTEQRTPAAKSNGYWTFTGASTTQTLAGPLVTTGDADPLFAYLDSSNTVITPAAGGLTAVQASTVFGVTVTTTVANTTGGSVDPVVLSNTVGLLNVALAAGN
ncbi:type II secretion system protein J [uncultured Amnibacterium sp.]|uniref:PulJ/GspJ family protein n=1 Tax=uncultured Amnibacterium sp. TaxID=1631851 RepID=UPI0035CADC92